MSGYKIDRVFAEHDWRVVKSWKSWQDAKRDMLGDRTIPGAHLVRRLQPVRNGTVSQWAHDATTTEVWMPNPAHAHIDGHISELDIPVLVVRASGGRPIRFGMRGWDGTITVADIERHARVHSEQGSEIRARRDATIRERNREAEREEARLGRIVDDIRAVLAGTAFANIEMQRSYRSSRVSVDVETFAAIARTLAHLEQDDR